MSPDIDEKAIGNRDTMAPELLTLLIAKAKAQALLPCISSPALLITSDQITTWNGVIREKPENKEICRMYLKSYDQYPAQTVTAVVVTNTKTQKQVSGVDIAKQFFKTIPDDVITELIHKGDVMHCSGGFMIDDPIIQPYLAERIGDEDSVIGMPIKLTTRLVDEAEQP